MAIKWGSNKKSAKQPAQPTEADAETLIGENQYGRYAVPKTSAHRIAARRILNGEIYEPETIELIRRECGDGDVVHAGTFFGDFLPGLASAMAPGAQIYAFEPNPDNFRCAEMTIELNKIDNVVVECIGLGPGEGRDNLLTVGADGVSRGGSSRIVQEGEQLGDGTVTVEVTIGSIDSRVPADRTVSVLQLDIEGHEQAALTGAMSTIERCRPLIILESVPDAWVEQHLIPLGYRAAETVHHNTVFRIA